jgi:hypothetical protein
MLELIEAKLDVDSFLIQQPSNLKGSLHFDNTTLTRRKTQIFLPTKL